MTGLEWVVVLASAGAIGWVNWYFFLADRSAAAVVAAADAGGTAAAVGGVPEVTIAVEGGYAPSTIRVRAGAPVRLVFDRQETSSCSEEVVFADFGIRRYLPTGQRTTIEVTPPRAGTYGFTCGMGMLRGTLIAE
ncbi:MAG TPA: cupredoxin domain-containing protein [Gemmatimonadaceae bacterium]|nr:cupredoxin domain-containing protein [Gemmatimonadaceae bacterium]